MASNHINSLNYKKKGCPTHTHTHTHTHHTHTHHTHTPHTHTTHTHHTHTPHTHTPHTHTHTHTVAHATHKTWCKISMSSYASGRSVSSPPFFWCLCVCVLIDKTSENATLVFLHLLSLTICPGENYPHQK